MTREQSLARLDAAIEERARAVVRQMHAEGLSAQEVVRTCTISLQATGIVANEVIATGAKRSAA